MQAHTSRGNVGKTAIGYVWVSMQEQATEGVSLDTQRDRLRLYCKSNDIKLIEIVADEGISGSTLNRPGLQAALQMIKRGRANTLIVAKLDRLSRSLRDVCRYSTITSPMNAIICCRSAAWLIRIMRQGACC